MAAVGSCLLFVGFVERPSGGVLADPRPGAVFFAVWTSLVAGWVCCRVGLWRLTADRDGVHIRRMWTVAFLPWSRIERVELRHDGLLEFVGAREAPLAGLFPPPWAGRPARRRGAGARAAQVLTEMARSADARPPDRAGRAATGSAFAPWAVPLAIVLFAAAEYVHR
ncbi:hypothetical protein SUDANB6_02771 [Streptomyces sp. enrichment culture]|uniref:hypothetical protein n=1 Tax=Streptomyces sp. enrichment culture TaxID=1795815 RepID=UPI003F54D54B